MSRNIILKVNESTNALTKITDVTPIKENNGLDIYYLLAPYGADTVMIKLLPNKFFELTNVNPIPAFKCVRITDQEVIDALVPEGDGETGWYLYYFPIGVGVSGILKSNRASQYQVSFQRLDVDLTDDDYIGNYATASTVDATISSELDVAYPSAVEGNYVNVYKTTSNLYTSWLLVSTTWVDQDSLTKETLIDNTLVYNETFKATTVSNDEFNIGTPSEQALVFNQIYGELEDINTVISAIVGDVAGLMTKAEYDTNDDGVVDNAEGVKNETNDAYITISKTGAGTPNRIESKSKDVFMEATVDNVILSDLALDPDFIDLYNADSVNGDTQLTMQDGEIILLGDVVIGTRVITDNTTDSTLDVKLNANVTGQMFQEELTPVLNNSGVNVSNGDLVYISGSSGVTAEITLATNTVKAKAHATIGMATEDINTGSGGFVTRGGLVRGIDTTAYAAGTRLYLGVDGAYTSTKPTPPTFLVEIGIVVKSGGAGVGSILINIEKVHEIEEAPDVKLTSIAAGEILARDSGNDYFENIDGTSVFMSRNIQNGAFKESFDLLYDTATSKMVLTNADGVTDYLTMQFSDGDTQLDTTSLSLAPTFGTATVPVTSYYYIPLSTKVLTVGTSWNTDEHIKVAEIVVLDEVTTDSEGPLGNRNWNNHEMDGTNDIGALQHIRARLRRLGAQWFSGVAGATSGEWVNDVAGTLYFTSTTGSVLQMHPQVYMAKDTSGTDDMHIVNDFTTPYNQIMSFDQITTYSDGSSIGNDHFNVFVYGICNKGGEYTPIMINTPTAGYNNVTDAQADLDATMVTTVPTAFRETAFPIARLLFKKLSSTYSFIQSYDLREQKFGISGTSGTGILDGEFTDDAFELQNVSDNTKVMKFNAGNQTTGTTRTVSMADTDIDLADIVLKVEKDLSNDTTYVPVAAAAVVDDTLVEVYIDDNGTPKKITLNEVYVGANAATGAFVASGDYSADGLTAYNSAELMYHDLTLDTLGKFKATIKTQETDHILYVQFPTITSNQNDLQVSTDNGTTYYDVLVNGATIYAELVSEMLIKLQFDGSNFIVDLQSLSQQLTFDSGANSIYGVVSGTNGSPEFNRLYGLSLNTIAYEQDVIDTGTINFDSVSGIDYYDWLNGVIIAGTGSNIVVTNATGSTADMMVVIISNTPIASKTASQLAGIISTYFEGRKDIVDFELQSIGLQMFDDNDLTADSGNAILTVISQTQFSIKSISASGIGLTILPNLQFKPDTQYTFNGSVYEDITGKNTRLRIDYTDGTSDVLYSATVVDTAFSFTSDSGKSIKLMTYTYSGSLGTSTITNFVINEGTTAEDWVKYNSPQDNFVLKGTNRSVGTDVRDEVYPLNGAWWHKAKVGVELLVAIGDVIDTTAIPLIKETTGVFEAHDNTNGEIQYGTYGDTLTLTNVSTVYYQLATPLDAVEIEKNGSLIQESNTTFVQLNNFATKIDITLALDSNAQLGTLVDRSIYQQAEIDDLEIEQTAQGVRITDIETKTDFISVSQPVDLDVIENSTLEVATNGIADGTGVTLNTKSAVNANYFGIYNFYVTLTATKSATDRIIWQLDAPASNQFIMAIVNGNTSHSDFTLNTSGEIITNVSLNSADEIYFPSIIIAR